MHEPAGVTEAIGREDEVALARSFVRGETPERLLVIEGSPGVGKTTVWRAALDQAQAANLRILQARAAEAESHMGYAVLHDLLAGVELDGLELPGPQRAALDTALYRRDAPGSSPPQAVALGMTHALRGLNRLGPVLLALDDLQWVDDASAQVLAFALRRAGPDGVRLLASRRSGTTTPVEQAVARDHVRTIGLEGLSLGATRRMLVERLGIELPRRPLRLVHDLTLGNPLYALEIGRLLATRGIPAVGEMLEVPSSLEELLAIKVTASPGARRALLAVALGGPLTAAELEAAVPDADLDDALEAGLLVEDGGRARPGHPLYAATAISRARRAEQRELHDRLARIAVDPIRRAQHLAAAAATADAALAQSIEDGAAAALARGLIHVAVELSEAALRLTPRSDESRPRRVVRLGEHLSQADERERLRELISAELATLPPGNDRAAMHLRATHASQDQEEFEGHLDAALQESTDPDLRARALAALAIDDATAMLRNYDLAEHRAAEAMAISPGGVSLYEAIHAMAWARIMRGRPIDDLRERLGDRDHPDFAFSLARVQTIRRLFRGDVDYARAYFLEQRDRAIEAGQENARSYTQHQMCETELRGGDLRAAGPLIAEHDPMESMEGMRGHRIRLLAVAAAMRGDIDDAVRLAQRAIDASLGLQYWDVLESMRARGIAALCGQEPARAVGDLQAVWDDVAQRGIEDPGAFPVAADLFEAAHAVGDEGLSGQVLDRLRALSQAQQHPWGLASVARCEGLVLGTEGRHDVAAERFAGAVAAYDGLGCRFDAARTLLAEGRAARRARRWAAARSALSAAAERFDSLGCTGWGDQARRLLDGIGGRRPAADGALTPSERRVAVLAAEGRSNKDIAAALYVGVHTVEVHLARAYAKLGVQSRAQLAKALTSTDHPPANH